MTRTITIEEDDVSHMRRLFALRESGGVNMVTQLRMGLEQTWGDEGLETYEWVRENSEKFSSAVWREQKNLEGPFPKTVEVGEE